MDHIQVQPNKVVVRHVQHQQQLRLEHMNLTHDRQVVAEQQQHEIM